MRTSIASLALIAGLAASQPGCSRNPATGRVQAFLISEDEEIALGKQTDAEVLQAMDLYEENPEATKLVDEIGKRIAKVTERPQLPWTFRVIDDPSVNAFALPGGYVYVTRGLLVHMNSADELAGVIGHECGHVTARHSAVQLRKQKSARRAVGVFRVVDPNLRHIGGLAASTAGLALLKHSRDDEYEADDLSVRYTSRVGFDTKAIPEMFGVLSKISDPAGRVPTWLSTHPDPEDRKRRISGKVGADGLDIADERYFQIIDKMAYGRDARRGFFVQPSGPAASTSAGPRFVHPRGGFQVDMPPQWQAKHDGMTLAAVYEPHKALLILGPDDAPTAKEGLDEFFADGQLARGELWEGDIGGFSAVSAAFSASYSDGAIMGLIAFVDFGSQVFVMIALSPQETWAIASPAVANTFASFRKITDPKLANVAPMRVRAVKLDRPTTLAAFSQSQPSVVSLEELALINHVEPNEALPEGRWVKRVVGFNPEPPEQAAGAKAKPPANPMR